MVETWLTEGFFSHEFFDERYVVIRRDRSSSTSCNKRGGGVLIAALKESDFNIIHHPDWQCDFVEDVWVTIVQSNGKRIHINCSYIPGDTSARKFESFFSNLTDRITALDNDEVIVLGDFNCPEFFNSNLSRSSKFDCLVEFTEFCGFTQFNGIINDISNTILDLVFSNAFIQISAVHDDVSKRDLFHPPFLISKRDNHLPASEKIRVFRNWKTADWDGIEQEINGIDWNEILHVTSDVDEMVNAFYEVLDNAINFYCPWIVKRMKPFRPHLSPALKRLLARKRKINSRLRRLNNPADAEELVKLQRECDSQAAFDRRCHFESIERDLNSNPKKFWSFINKKRSNGAGVADYVTLNGEMAETKEDAAKLFAKHFSSVFSDSITSNSRLSTSATSGRWNEIVVTIDDVYKKLLNLNVKKGSGPDGFPPSLFKRCASTLAYPLFVIFNTSLQQGVVPSKFKLSFVVPIHKNGSQNDVRNYRPISKMSIIAKILDSIVADALFENFRHVITPHQHGFFKGRSTTTNLIGYTERIQRAINAGKQVDVIYTDFSKAFDKVDHSILLNKLEHLGICGTLLSWFESYLKGRTQRVQIGDALSDIINVTSSVVQGSHCGPILFAIFINDIAEVLGVDFNFYADDIKIFVVIDSLNDCDRLQTSLNQLANFASDNNLALNVDKCFVASFTRKTKNFICYDYSISDKVLNRKDVIRDLGVSFDGKCSFSSHINVITSKARRSLGFIMRNSQDFTKVSTVITLYAAFCRSILEYASPVWSPTTTSHIKSIERVQHKFLIFVARKFFNDRSTPLNYSHYEERLKLKSLENRRIIADIKFIINAFKGTIDSSTFLHLFTLHVPSRVTKTKSVFSHNRRDSCFNRMMTNFNLFVNNFDSLTGHSSLAVALREAELKFLNN